MCENFIDVSLKLNRKIFFFFKKFMLICIRLVHQIIDMNLLIQSPKISIITHKSCY